MPNDAVRVESLAVLSRFRTDFYACLSARVDALFELTDALLCAEGPVKTLVGLSLAPEHRRGHGALYDALNKGFIEVERLRGLLAGLPLSRCAGGRLVLAVDVSAWLRPDAATSPERLFCHVYGRGKNQAHVDRLWQAFLRRFDLEHTFRMFKQTLGWTTPRLRDPAAADRWTWLLITAHTQLRLARQLTDDLRRPWERPSRQGRLTPARVRRGFRNLRPKTSHPAGAPKPSAPGPGRPRGSKNYHRAPHPEVGKTTKRQLTITERKDRPG